LRLAKLIVIHDPDPLDRARFEERIAARKGEFLSAGVAENSFEEAGLLADLDTISAAVDPVLQSGVSNIVLDISAMPKRWFFAILKLALSDERAKNIIVTYASPAK
jgi:hypothetical protein